MCLAHGIVDKDNEMHTPSESTGTTPKLSIIPELHYNRHFYPAKILWIKQNSGDAQYLA